jgi:hypothetical protein
LPWDLMPTIGSALNDWRVLGAGPLVHPKPSVAPLCGFMDPVTAEQMRYLFGEGRHPLTAELTAEAADMAAAEQVTRLGLPFKTYRDDSPFRREVAARFAAVNRAAGRPACAALPAAERARIRTEVAREFFHRQHGRDPMDARELSGILTRLSRPARTAVAGYDLTFSPVKSVSTLWAVADRSVAAQVEEAHHAAVADALRFVERHALFSRVGANGVRQVDVKGLVRRRSPIATAGPVIRICTPMWRWPTRCKPWMGGGCRSMGGCCSRRPWRRRRPTTPRSSTTSVSGSESGSPTG